MATEADIRRERELLGKARAAAAELLDAATELRWYTSDPLGAAMGHVEAVLRGRGQIFDEPPAATERRRGPLPFRAVWDRDDWTCQHCGVHTDLTVDHIVPWSAGGSDELDNLQTLCGGCNSRKGAR